MNLEMGRIGASRHLIAGGLVVVIEADASSTDAGPEFRSQPFREASFRAVDCVEIVEGGSILQARIVSLIGPPGQLRARTPIPADENGRTQVGHHAVQAGCAVEVSVAESI